MSTFATQPEYSTRISGAGMQTLAPAQGEFHSIAENLEIGLGELQSLICRIALAADRLGGSLPECSDRAESPRPVSAAVTHRFGDAAAQLHQLNGQLANSLSRLERLV